MRVPRRVGIKAIPAPRKRVSVVDMEFPERGDLPVGERVDEADGLVALHPVQEPREDLLAHLVARHREQLARGQLGPGIAGAGTVVTPRATGLVNRLRLVEFGPG